MDWQPVARSETPATQPAALTDPAVLQKVLPEVNFAAVPLRDVADFLTDITQNPVTGDWQALDKFGISHNTPITLQDKQVKLGNVIRELVKQANAKATNDQRATFRCDADNSIHIIVDDAKK